MEGPRGPRGGQEEPKRGVNGPATDRPEKGERRSKQVSEAEEGPREAEEGPRRTKTAQERAKRAQGGPRGPERGPRELSITLRKAKKRKVLKNRRFS